MDKKPNRNERQTRSNEEKEEDKLNREKEKEQNRLRKASLISEYQAKINACYKAIDSDMGLTKYQKKILKKEIKEKKGLIFDLKHPVASKIIEGMKDFGGLIMDFADAMSDISSSVYDNTYGGSGYTESDKAEVFYLTNRYGAVAGSMARANIEERINNENSSKSSSDNGYEREY